MGSRGVPADDSGRAADPAGALPMLAGAFAQYSESPEAAIESVTGGPADEAVLGDPARPAWAQILSAVTEDRPR